MIRAPAHNFQPLFARVIVATMRRPGLNSAVALAIALSSFGGCQGPTAAAEADLARRTAAVTLRERAVELREKAVADREAALRQPPPDPIPATSPQAADAPASRAAHTAKEAELSHRRVLDDMDAKGLLPSDLPPDAARLDKQIYAAIRAGAYDRAVDLTAKLGRAVAAVEVDRTFLDAKMRRVAGLRSHKPVSADTSSEIDLLLQEVTSLAADGEYGTANRRVNRIAALLE
jgi:hypothetical protein